MGTAFSCSDIVIIINIIINVLNESNLLLAKNYTTIPVHVHCTSDEGTHDITIQLVYSRPYFSSPLFVHDIVVFSFPLGGTFLHSKQNGMTCKHFSIICNHLDHHGVSEVVIGKSVIVSP